MATKDFSKIGNKKLVKMLETASEEDKLAIQAVLDSRAQVKKATHEAATLSETTPEEVAALSEVVPEQPKETKDKPKKTTKADLSPEQIEAEVAEAKKNVGHKCQILPFGEIDWIEGYVAGVVVDKRSNNIMYRIKADNKYSHKEIHAKTIKISEELAEIPVHVSTGGRTSGDKRTDEEAEKMLAEAKVNKGRYVMIADEKFVINSVMRDKRSNAVMYKLIGVGGTVEGKNMYKTVNNTNLVMLDEWNEEIKNRAERQVKELTAKEKLLIAYDKLEKAKAAVEKLTAEIAELEKIVNETPAETTEETPAETTEETSAEAAGLI